MKPIKQGDKVTLYWMGVKRWTRRTLEGVVTHMPIDIGDHVYIEDKEGRVHMVNCLSPDFIKMVKELE